MQKYWQGCWNPVACNISPSSIHETAFHHGQKTHNAVCQEAPHFPWKVEYQNATGQRRCFITNALTMTSLSHSIRHQCPSTAGNFLYKHTRISNNWLHVLTIPQLPSRWSQTFTSLSRPHDYKLHCYSSHTKVAEQWCSITYIYLADSKYLLSIYFCFISLLLPNL